MVLASFVDCTVVSFSSLLSVFRFIFVQGYFTTISWNGGGVASCRAVAPVCLFCFDVIRLVCCFVWLFFLEGFSFIIKLCCVQLFSEDIFYLTFCFVEI